MRGVDFDPVGANGFRIECCGNIGGAQFVELSQRRGASVGAAGPDERRGADGCAIISLAQGAFVPQLDQHVAARRVNLLDAAPPSVPRRLVHPRRAGLAGGRRMIDGAGFADDEPHAALGAAAIVRRELLGRGPGDTEPALHGGHDEPVRQLQAAQAKRRE